MNLFNVGSQASFLFEIKDNASVITVVNFQIIERISAPYVVNITLASMTELKFEDMLQKEALLTIKEARTERYFHGIVRKFEMAGKNGLNYLYDAQIVPILQLFSLEQDCKIFQNKNIQDIVADIFKDSGIPSDRYDFRLKNKEHKRRFCVQYRERDLDFVSRLLEEEGIYYFFEHARDKHVIVFADDPVHYKPINGNSEITFKSASGLTPEKQVIHEIDFSRKLRTGAYTQTNYNFKHPSAPMEATDKHKEETIQKFEFYDYPGQYGDQDQGKKLTMVRQEEQTALQEQVTGSSNCPHLIPGCTFKLSGHDLKTFNREYFILQVTHAGSEPQALKEQAGGAASYGNRFSAIPSSISYRPLRRHEKPYIKGIQSATVVGPKNEEIYVDEHGRVKVQFHWDRLGKNDEQSSCWLRCGQTWGGGGWGAVFIPRIGDEVMVDFMEGDPDWPIITGSCYNAANPPLYDLPGNKTRSTIKTKSYPNSNGYNELRFEDKAGQEEIYLQGEKDWNILIKHDTNQTIGHDETLSVGNNRTKTVGVNQSETIGVNKSIQVGANHSENIGANMTLTVGMNKTDTTGINCAETIGLAKELTVGGLYQVSVGADMNETVIGGKTEEVGLIKAVVVANNMTEYVKADRKSTVDGNFSESVAKKHSSKANEYILEAPKITLKAGNSTIVMDGSSIMMKSEKVFQN